MNSTVNNATLLEAEAASSNASIQHQLASCVADLQLDRWSVATGLALGAISVATIFGNSLVLLAVLLHRSLRSTTAIFVSNLAVADLLLGACVLPFSSALEVTHGCWLFGSFLCDLWAAVDVLCCTASIMSLCAISMDRYVGVTRPLQRARIVTHRRASIIVLCVWLLSGLVSVGPLIGWRSRQRQPHSCAVSDNPLYVLLSSLLSFYLPLAIVAFFYIRVYQAAARQTRFLASGVKTTRAGNAASSSSVAAANSCNAAAADNNKTSISSEAFLQPAATATTSSSSFVTLRVHRGGCGGGGGGGTQGNYSSRLLAAETMQSDIMTVRAMLHSKLAKFRREKKAAKTLGIVVGVFIVCWLPFFFVYPFKMIVCQSCRIPELAFKIVFWLGYCNSLCNPVIYACWNRDFRRAFAHILACRSMRKRPPPPPQPRRQRQLAGASSNPSPSPSWSGRRQPSRTRLTAVETAECHSAMEIH